MTDATFAALMHFLMCDDPSALFKWTRNSLEWHADNEALGRGYKSWIDAYHGLPILVETSVHKSS